MIQLTYISTAARDIVQADIDAILAVARRRNNDDSITGLLLYNGRRFLQTLEGEEAAVRRAYERISADPRHRAVVALGSRVIAERSFPSWAMAATRVSDGPDVVDLARQVAALTEEVSDPSVRDHFRGFAVLHRAA